MRTPVLLAVIAASGATGLIAASIVTGSVPAQPGSDRPDDAVPASIRVIARTSDPRGGPDWGVRAYQGATGLRCLSVGRLNGKRFGRLDDSGQITELGADGSGSCGATSAGPTQLAVSRAAASKRVPASSTLFGTVDAAQVAALRVTDPRGATSEVAVSTGAVLMLVEGSDAPTGSWVIELTLADGRKESITL
ncbi:MAG: hypothetical protein ACR2NB_11740 [Solirubrobacteraceae bacterium]